MNSPRKTSLAQSLESALAWWEEAGVDMDFLDTPTQWLTDAQSDAAGTQDPETSTNERVRDHTGPRPDAAHQMRTQPAIAPIGKGENAPPHDLTAFADWWRTDPSLDGLGGTGPRIAARGNPGADLMILVPEPEAEDTDKLLSGPRGKLLDSMLRAMGISEGEFHLAAALPRHAPHHEWPSLAEAGLRDVTLQRIKMAAPKRLIILGRNILPLVSNDPANIGSSYHEINHETARILVFTSWDLGTLLLRAKARSSFWRNWLDWTEGTT